METDSEKLLKDTLNYMDHNDLIQWHYRFSQKFSPAPLDFEVWIGGEVHHVEVKESQEERIRYSVFGEDQRRLLNLRSNTHLLLRFYSGEYTRAHSDYYEYYLWCPGSKAPNPMSIGSIKLNSLIDSPSVYLVGWREGDQCGGIENNAGLTTRDNPSEGLPELSKEELWLA